MTAWRRTRWEQLVTIDARLQEALAAFHRATGVPLSWDEIERLMADRTTDLVSEKRYVFTDATSVTVKAKVDEYEPETVWLSADGDRQLVEALRKVVERKTIR